MKLKRMILGIFDTNCYVVQNNNKECVVIDPAANGKKIANYIDTNELTLKAILITHGHFDHIIATDYLYDKYHCPIYCHEETCELLHNGQLNLSTRHTNEAIVVKAPLTNAQPKFMISDFEIEWLFLPGHCIGNSMIYFKNLSIIFSGDVLFQGSIGRTDLPTSSTTDTMKTLQTIREYDFDCDVYPGHGQQTTILQEQQYNPYLNYK